MKLPNNKIEILIKDIPSTNNIKFILTDSTLVGIKINKDLIDSTLSQRLVIAKDNIKSNNIKCMTDLSELVQAMKIDYKDVHDIVESVISKVFFNTEKLRAIIQGLSNPNNTEMIKKWVIIKNDAVPTGFVQLFKYKFHITQPRYQDKRRVERMVKEYKFLIVDNINKEIKLKIEEIYSKYKNINTVNISDFDEINRIYLQNSMNHGNDIIVPVALPNKATVFIKEDKLLKSKYVKDMSAEEILRILSIAHNIKYGGTINYVELFKEKEMITLKII